MVQRGSKSIQLVIGNGYPLTHKKVLPNDPCPCGSGKKAKKCCGTETTFAYSKLTERQIEEVKKRQEAEKREAGLVAK